MNQKMIIYLEPLILLSSVSACQELQPVREKIEPIRENAEPVIEQIKRSWEEGI